MNNSAARAWLVVAMLFLFTTINFFDKLVLGLSAVPIMRELGISPAGYGLVASSFFWLYAVSGVLVGLLLIDRIATKWLLVGLVAIWSVSQIPVAFTSSLGVLVGCRVVLGIGEGPGTSAAIHACHSWFPSERRNLPGAIVLQGTSVGFLLGAPVLTHVVQTYGWRTAFLCCSTLGLAWLAAWIAVGADGPIAARRGAARLPASSPRVPWPMLWLDRTMLGTYVLGFGAYWMAGIVIAWLAPYLQVGLGFNPRSTGWLISVMYAAGPPCVLGISYWSEALLRHGRSSAVARGAMNGGCMVAGGLALLLSTQIGLMPLKLVLLTIAVTLPPLTFVLGPAMVSEIAPTAQRGTALLVTFSGITVAGFLSPAAFGLLVQQAGAHAGALGYTRALLAASILVIGCGIIGWALVRPDATAARFRARLG